MKTNTTRPTSSKKKRLPLFPNPQPYEQHPDEESDEVRHLHCRRYDTCLKVAEVFDWPGFTCAECPVFAEQNGAAEHRDYHGLLDLAAEILIGDPANDNDDPDEDGEDEAA